ncbi:PBECR4 domain-containing protein [Bifidobacterium oedipodis]|uniref:Phage-Barnase-EndoU-ColicinE5/D-RelE like nuclease 4 domain-containing protein n=1 Tax=Bifidobacterium oedipodis TaxID=2675322 RepID=A0A7Y0ERS6_9BIFI|nr:PBECR4 domain-containing protein [Bifidobacterium sp. DSM 109957]NMM95212.1 hypothetical protein [Bifidobacterium sp. DSM 109957]
MVALVQLKRELISAIHSAALEYDRVLCERHMIIICEDGYSVDVLWRKDCLMHLCGVKCNRPPSEFKSKTRRGEAEYFYDAILSNRLSPNSITIPNERFAKRKAKTLPLLSRIPELDLELVETNKDYLALAIGDELFTLGLAPMPDTRSEFVNGPVMFPRTLRAQKITAIAQPGTPPHKVANIRIK